MRKMHYFALSDLGELVDIGKHSSFDAASEHADSLDEDVMWIVDYKEAMEWVQVIRSNA